ncbi:MAG TPA: hypothetical protein VJT49_21030 [Amycolatopsis sp.]|nr:hypothetical protein [Amycolatopsis sp.]HKS47546.1 hypothetical protein [Amycolatopsis sp.]
MDVTFVIDGRVAEFLASTQPNRVPLLAAFSQGARFHRPAGRRLDTYLIEGRPILNPGTALTDEEVVYYRARGYWDDFWQRCRSGAKSDPITVADALPRRGYLEVKPSPDPPIGLA